MVKWLGFPNPRPTRKADMAVAIKSRLTAMYLRQLWNDLDKVEQAAVSEALYSPARNSFRTGSMPSTVNCPPIAREGIIAWTCQYTFFCIPMAATALRILFPMT